MAVAVRIAEPDVEVRKKLTPEDVDQMLADGRLCRDDIFELDDGEIVELAPVHGDHGYNTLNIAAAMQRFARKSGGKAFDSSTGFMVGEGLKQLRSPDVSYFGPSRAPKPGPHFVEGAPDLAVEVLSRGQHTEAYAKPKVREYFDAGAQLVWLVDVIKREVRVYRKDSDEITVMRGKAVLTLEPIIGGFKLKVADIFS